MRKLRHGKEKYFAQGHPSNKWCSWLLNPGQCDFKPRGVLLTICRIPNGRREPLQFRRACEGWSPCVMWPKFPLLPLCLCRSSLSEVDAEGTSFKAEIRASFGVIRICLLFVATLSCILVLIFLTKGNLCKCSALIVGSLDPWPLHWTSHLSSLHN